MSIDNQRACEFGRISSSLGSAVKFETEDIMVALGDSLKLLQSLPDNSVSLVLTDPPYHSTKKSNIYGDTAFEEDEHFIDWLSSFAQEWQRVLKLSGTLYVFCSSEMSARLELAFSKYFRPLNHVTWSKPNEPGFDGWKGKAKKESLRRWYPHSERILVFEQGSYGKASANRPSPLGEFLRETRSLSKLSMKDLAEATGAYGNVNHGGSVANWEAGRNVPSRDQYLKIVSAFLDTKLVVSMPSYEDLVRPMNLDAETQFTDVWDFPSVRPFPGKHPAEKPQAMLQHIIGSSSYPGDIVLDCFAGSGSSLLAARSLGRKAVGIEIEETWVERAIRDLNTLV
jgi:site-specific DNA-methyltransferase (adenine-specific)